MAEIKVTSTELKSKAAELRQLNNQFKKAVEDMTSTEQQLMGMWDGETKEAFHNAFNNDKTQMDNFFNAIEVYAQRLEAAAAKYEQAEAQNTEIATTRTYS